MDIKQRFETPILLEFYDAIKKALEIDDKLPENQKDYYVREFPDWRDYVSKIEEELDKREVKYTKIKW